MPGDRLVRRALVEGLVITASILLAFTLDRWWDVQQEAAHIEELEFALVAEFEATVSELQAVRSIHSARTRAAQALVDLAPDAATSLGGDSLLVLFSAALFPTMTDPPRGALSSVISAGDLRLIRGQELRSRLAGWENRLEDMWHTETNIRELLLNRLSEDVAHATPFPDQGGVVDDQFVAALRGVPIRNHLKQVVLITDIVLNENQALQDEVRQILGMLRQEVGS